MSAPFGFPPGAAPGMPGVPQQQQQPQGAFVLDIPPDLSWEPFETTDTLANDGYYCGQITKESPRNDSNKSNGIFLTIQLMDDDVKGKMLSKFLPDSKATTKNTWFLWRGLLRSIYGGEAGKTPQGFRYTPGCITNAYVYFKTSAYLDDGVMRTGIDVWSTREEWEANKAKGTHRWPAKAPQVAGGGVGALPGGLPSAFPGGGPGLPSGGPTAPAPFPPMQQPTTPQPQASAPMVSAPLPSAGFPPPQPTVPQQQPQAAPAPSAPPPPFQFAPQQAAPPPPQANGAAPPNTAAGIMANFPPPPTTR